MRVSGNAPELIRGRDSPAGPDPRNPAERIQESNGSSSRSSDSPKIQFHLFLLTPYFDPCLLPQAQSL
jgi:hypothetical protein